jgi:hypothetical protein
VCAHQCPPGHVVAERRGMRHERRHYVARPDCWPSTAIGSVRSTPMAWSTLSAPDELLTERVLEGHAARCQHARDHRDVPMLHLDALDGTDALREDEALRLRERRQGEEAPLLFRGEGTQVAEQAAP